MLLDAVMEAHHKPSTAKMEPSFTMVVPGTDGSSCSCILPMMPFRCTHMHPLLSARPGQREH